jgi:hypothetical protein
MAENQVVYYDGGDGGRPSGYALAPRGTGVEAPVLIVFPENGDTPFYERDVPKRAEGGGRTFRDRR